MNFIIKKIDFMKTNWTHFICLCFHRKSFIALGFLCCSTETSSRGLEKQSSGLVFLGRKKVRNWGFFELVEMLEEQPKQASRHTSCWTQPKNPQSHFIPGCSNFELKCVPLNQECCWKDLVLSCRSNIVETMCSGIKWKLGLRDRHDQSQSLNSVCTDILNCKIDLSVLS